MRDLPNLAVPSTSIFYTRQVNRAQMIIDRTAEALDVFAAVIGPLVKQQDDNPVFREAYQEAIQTHAHRIVEAVLGLSRHV